MTNTPLDGVARAIGDEIREARVRLDMTKAEAARRAGVSRRTWHEIEEGTRVASSAETLALFDQVLGFDEGHLFSMTSRSATARIETLRRQAMEMLKLMSSDELQAFVDTEGRETINSQLADMRRELAELRQIVTESETSDADGRSGDTRRGTVPASGAGSRRSRGRSG